MNKVALVTGGTRGIGLGIARSLASEGYDLALCGVRRKRDVKAIVQALSGPDRRVLYQPADLANSGARLGLIEMVRKEYGRLDVLVNNAGVAPRERNDILDATEESFEWVMRINLQGPYFLTQLAANWMIEQKQASGVFDGCIVTISSISATVASVNRGEYCISKAGLAMATRLWAVRLAPFNIPVYEIRPGIIRTDMTSSVTAKYDALIEDGLLLQARWGTPVDVGSTVASLARGDMPYSTGQVIMVDGGMTVNRL